MFMMVFAVASYGMQEGDPPGEGQGCNNYDDTNGNGLYDEGEPCYDEDGPSFADVDTDGDGLISHDEAEAEFGDEPDFENHFSEVDTDDDGSIDSTEFAAQEATPHGPPMAGTEGEHPEHPEAGAEGEHVEGCPPTNDFHANCGAICAGADDYWVDRDGDCGEAEDGPYATWDEPDCPACPDEGGH